MKCHHCQQEMVKLPNNWDLSCPKRHGHVKIMGGQIAYYRLYLYPSPDIRITIEQSEFNGKLYLVKHTKVPQFRKNKKGQTIKAKPIRERKTLFTLDKMIAPKLDDNEIIQGQLLYEKLKLYLLFS